MKFLVTSGKKKGLTFEVTEDASIRLGRGKENEIVIDDESISSQHAKILVENDEVVVEDSDSINGIELNGKSVKKSPLEAGDIITIGLTKITVVADDGDSDADHPVTKKTKEGAKPKWGGLKKVLAVLLVGGVIAAGLLVLKSKRMGLSPRTGEAAAAGMIEGVFRLRYEKVKASSENIFRYELRIENGALAVAIDDLKQARHVQRNKEITSAQIAMLQDSLRDQQISSLTGQIEGKSQEVWDSYQLVTLSRGEAHSVKVLNRLPPDNFKKICDILENFGETELGMVALSMPLEELQKRAQDSVVRARKLYEERFVKAENLFNSIKAYSETIWYLDTIEPKPSIYADAIHGKEVASEELDQQLEDHKFRATRATQLKDWAKAREELALILQKFPDESDKRNQEARVRLLDVQQRLQPK